MKLQYFFLGVGFAMLAYGAWWALDRVALYVVTREDIKNLLESDE